MDGGVDEGGMESEMELHEKDALIHRGLLSRAGSGTSSSSTDSGSSSSTADSRSTALSSLFDRCSNGAFDERRSSFASSVGSICSGSSMMMSGKQEDLQTPTVEHGRGAAGTAAGSSATATATKSSNSSVTLSLSQRLRELELAGNGGSTSKSSTVSSPNTVRANSDESARTLQSRSRPSTRNGPASSSTSAEGFPWNATSSSMTSNASMKQQQSSSSSSSLGTPSAIFSNGLEDSDSESDDDIDRNNQAAHSSTGSRPQTGTGTGRGVSSAQLRSHNTASTSAASSLPSSRNNHPARIGSETGQSAATGAINRNYGTASSSGSEQHQYTPAASASTSAMFHYAPPSSIPLSSSAVIGGGAIPYSSPYPASTSQSRCSTACSVASRDIVIDTAKRSSGGSTSNTVQYSARPSTASSCMSASTSTSASARPWIRDSDASSLKSAGGVSSDGSLQDEQSGETLSVMSPAAPPPVPFLPTGPQPAGCRITVDSSSIDHFTVIAALPGFSIDNITLALKRNGSLHILADRYDDASASASTESSSSSTSKTVLSSRMMAPSASTDGCGGHFERMVELGEAAIGSKVQAEFDGKRLKVTVPKRGAPSPSTFNASSGGSGFRHPGASTSAGRKSSMSSISSASSSAAMISPSLASVAGRCAPFSASDARLTAAGKEPQPIHRMSRGGLGN